MTQQTFLMPGAEAPVLLCGTGGCITGARGSAPCAQDSGPKPKAPSRHESPAEVRRFHRCPFQCFIAAACVLFGLALIANVQLGYEGGWFWYAVLRDAGFHLYHDLHLVVQPLIILETQGWMALAGKGWIVSKVPAVFHLLAFVAGIALVGAQSKWTDFEKAVMLAFAFFTGIHFEAYRFDDYHVVAHVCYLFSLYFLLQLDQGRTARKAWVAAPALGVLSGLAIVTRLTDGVLLALATALAIALLATARRSELLVQFWVLAALTVLGMVKLTGDSFRDYAAHTILRAAAPKGGAEHVLFYPLKLFWNSLVLLGTRRWPTTIVCAIVAGLSWSFLIRPISHSRSAAAIVKAAAGAVLLAVCVRRMIPHLKDGGVIVILSAVWVLAALALMLLVLYRLGLKLLRHEGKIPCPPREMLLLLPFVLLLSGAMSSGGYHYGLYAPVAFFVLLLPVVFPIAFAPGWLKSFLLMIAALMAVSGAYSRAMNPCSWHSFGTMPLFRSRSVIRHPVYGAMIIDDKLHAFIEPICAEVIHRGNRELLSIPFPYANYFCGVPPWQNFVQSFFDTAGKDVIDRMISKLRESPPQWVLYQRQLENLARHEQTFNGGRIVHTAEYGPGNEWMLISTR